MPHCLGGRVPEASTSVYTEPPSEQTSDRDAFRQYVETSRCYLQDLQTHDEDYHRQFIHLVEQWLPGGSRVLDLGCGTGFSTSMLRERGYDVVGADLSTLFLRQGGQHERVDLVAADAESLPFPSASFQAVVSFEFIEHVADVPAVLSESIRVLAPRGILLFHSPNLCSPFFPLLDLVSLLLGRGGRPVFAETRTQAFGWLRKNSVLSLRKLRSRYPEFVYRKPDLTDQHVGGDADSLYLACQIDLAKYLRRQHMEVLQRAWGDRAASRLLARLFPDFAPYIALVARKPDSPESVLNLR